MTYLYIIPLTPAWYIVVGSFVFITTIFLLLGSYIPSIWKVRLLRFIDFYLLFDLLFMEAYLLFNGNFSLQTSLPLSFCSVMQLVAAFAAITQNAFLFEFALFFAIAGPIQAFLTPAVVYQGEEFILIDFFIAHGLTVIAPLFMTLCLNFAPRKWAAVKSIGIMQFVVICIYGINIHLGANYMYLCEKPNIIHPLNTAAWPYYVLNWHLLFYSIPLLIQGAFYLKTLLDNKTTGKITY